MRTPIPARWVAITVFIFASVLNYLDRQILATMVDIWRARPEFPFTYDDYGLLLAVFSIAYASSALFTGWFVDRVGLNRGAGWAVALWALASFGTGASHSVHELLIWRALLGISEATAIAAVTKAVALYLQPSERAIGQAMSQLGLSLGAGLAPAFAVYFSYRYSWHWAFYAAGFVSLAWIPLWLGTSRKIPPMAIEKSRANATTLSRSFSLLRDPQLWALMIANMLGMTVYGLWANWAPTFLIRVHHLTPPQAAHYTWIVPLAGYLGALSGGAISWRLVRGGHTPVAARKRACFIAAVFLIVTAGVPLLPTPALATLGMSFSFACVCAWSVNHYTLPIDIYGAERAAFGGAALVFSYGVMQSLISRPLASVIEQFGFNIVCITFACLPIASYLLVHLLVADNSNPKPITQSQLKEKILSTS